MKAWRTTGTAGGLSLTETRVPEAAEDEVLVHVDVCGICRTDLHVIDQEIPRHSPFVTPGHQAVGTVVSTGSKVAAVRVGDLVGVAWLRRTCGQCDYCRTGSENLCPRSEYTGWDADGGFAEYLVAPAAYVYRLDPEVEAVAAAPLLCAGIIGYRALTRARVPDGGSSASTALGPALT